MAIPSEVTPLGEIYLVHNLEPGLGVDDFTGSSLLFPSNTVVRVDKFRSV